MWLYRNLLNASLGQANPPAGQGSQPEPPKFALQPAELSYTFSSISGTRWDPILPSALRGSVRTVVWRNPSGVGASGLQGRALLASPDGSRAFLIEAETFDKAPGGLSVRPNDSVFVSLPLPDGLPPNAYRGELVLGNAAGEGGRVPITWNVRDGAVLPGFLILVGIVVARLAKPAAPNAPAPTGRMERVSHALLGIGPDPQKPSQWLALLVLAVLYVALLVSGYSTLYLSGSPTFGSGGIADYLPLLLWGFGATVLNRTLWNWQTA